MRPQGEPVVRSESSSGRRGRIVSKSSETTRLLCALGSWAPRLRPHEWDMAGAIEMSARSGKNKNGTKSRSMRQIKLIHSNTWPQMIKTGITKVKLHSHRRRQRFEMTSGE